MDIRLENRLIRFGQRKKAFIFYTGLSYCKNFYHCETGDHFDLDMDFSYDSHMQQLHEPLNNMGLSLTRIIILNIKII